MRAALYDPDQGYYTAGGNHIGPDGDFYTSPSTHPIFGALIALQMERLWELMDRPETFTIVEGGGAKGLLARTILSYTEHLDLDFRRAVRYWVLEPERRARVHPSGAEDPQALVWEGSAALPSIEAGAFLSNELFDAYPVHRVIRQGGQLYELYVDLAGEDFIESPDLPSTPALEEHFREVGIELPEGCRADVDLEGPRRLGQIGHGMERGFVVSIDYGYPAEMLYGVNRRQGTLLCYHRHLSSPNPYIRIGRQDITAHVDFTALARTGERVGLHTEGLLTQQRYLKKLGIQSYLDRLRESRLPPDAHTANQMAILELTRANGFGQFGVLVQSKGTGAPWGIDTIAISRVRDGLGPLPLPLLTAEYMPLLEAGYPHFQAFQGLDLWPTG